MAENALGSKLEDVFEYFDEEPLGAASIGQVHAARLKTGEDVVVKVGKALSTMMRGDFATGEPNNK